MKNLIVRIGLLLAAVGCIQCTDKAAVSIEPAKPERGQEVVISYDSSAADAKLPATAEEVSIQFSYSTLYDLPYELPMKKNGSKWEVSFTLPRYAVYATFYFKSGDSIDKPAPDRHYELVVYKDGKPIENASLYKAYSLSAQIGKSDSLDHFQAKLFEKELEQYPDSYEAKVRLLNYCMKYSEGKQQQDYKNEVHEVIAKKFLEDPNSMGNVNKVTMGYLIIGEKSRVDSIYHVVSDSYPNGAAAKELYPSRIAKENDVNKRIVLLEAALVGEPDSEEITYKAIHQALFNAYLEKGNEEKAVYHAQKLAKTENPYTPQARLRLAEQLTEKNIGLDTALTLAQQALDSVANYPVGIIRYFPEYGHILPYVDSEKRADAVATAKANIVALTAVIYAKQGKFDESKQAAEQVALVATDDESLNKLAEAYSLCGDMDNAIASYRKLLVKTPTNIATQNGIKQVYSKRYGSARGLDTLMVNVNAEWRNNMLAQLSKERLDKDAPQLTNIVDMQGKALPADFMKGKVVFISFWATWCSPCMQEMPYIQKVYDKYKNNPKVAFLIINSGARNSFDDAKNWSEKSSYTMPIYYNQNPDIGSIFEFSVIPATFVIDTKDKLQFKAIGFEGPAIESRIDMEIELLLSEFNG